MWRMTAPGGRTAWYCGDDPGAMDEMAAELFPGVEVVVEERGEAGG